MTDYDTICLLEMARVALTHEDMRERIAVELDLSDEEMSRLEELNKHFLEKDSNL